RLRSFGLYSIFATFKTTSPISFDWHESRYGGSSSLYVSSGVGGVRLSHPSTTSTLQVPHAPSPPQTWLMVMPISRAADNSVFPAANSADFPSSTKITRGIRAGIIGEGREITAPRHSHSGKVLNPVSDKAAESSGRLRRAAKRSALPLLLAIITLAVVGLSYFLYVRHKTNYFVERDLRLLASAAVQVDDAFTRNAGYVKNFSKLSDAGSRVRRALSNSDLVKEIDLYFREFETLTHPKNQPYKEKPPADVAEIRNRLAHAPNMEEFETTIVPRDKTHW